ncbi:TlpA family protein disulfide reductase [Bacteriovorax sp. PP10]|uniref:TlpA family protein disulfide reductase n=1 Tax=Bacteriovorax antarcticus TaxID=3088717 RepID=A0ABU5VV40_9BACT|nr:TlpA family protein disulfide reductase [Bacteriovorax sp. PP10]MEA9356234.1 TlpA family protein disulfide reductase [Bacteriovorax sp. PP10]
MFYQTSLLGSDLINIPSKDYSIINSEKQSLVKFPPQSRSIVLFWASWCGPCKIEMARLRSSVESGKIKPIQIFAINPFETLVDIKKFVSTNNYPFTFLDAADIGFDLSISSTPTTLFLEGEKIISRSSGMSLLGIWKAEKYLR